MFAQCRRKWTLAYLFGIKEGKRTKGKLLGSVIHACLEAYALGGNVYDPDLRDLERELAHLSARDRADLLAEAPRRAIVALPYIPLPHEAERYPESKFEGVCAVSGDNHDPLRFVLKLDLLARYHAEGSPWYLYDYKSTKGKRVTGQGFDPWYYVPSVEALQRDVASVFYALEAMLRLGLDELWCRWVYTCTERKELPVAKVVDFLMTREHCEREISYWLEVAYEMRSQVREAIDRNEPPALEDVPVPVLPPDPDSPCDAYSGCPYRAKALGPCDPGHGSVGLAVLRTKQHQPKEEIPVMSLSDRVEQAVASGAAALPHNAPEGYAVNPTAPFQVYLGAPTLPTPTGEPWLDETGQPVINGSGAHLDTAGHPMPSRVTPPAVRPVSPPAARVVGPVGGETMAATAVGGNAAAGDAGPRDTAPAPPPATEAKHTRRPRQKKGESIADYTARVNEYNASKGLPRQAPSDDGDLLGMTERERAERERAERERAERERAERERAVANEAVEPPVTPEVDPGAAALLRFFQCAHLPAHLQDVAKPFAHLAVRLTELAPASAERTMALRKLLEAKDCAVRAALD